MKRCLGYYVLACVTLMTASCVYVGEVTIKNMTVNPLKSIWQ